MFICRARIRKRNVKKFVLIVERDLNKMISMKTQIVVSKIMLTGGNEKGN